MPAGYAGTLRVDPRRARALVRLAGRTSYPDRVRGEEKLSIGYAYDLIRAGRADVMFAGGTDPFSG